MTELQVTPSMIRGTMKFHKKMYMLFKQNGNLKDAQTARQYMIELYLRYRKVR